ncbi:MAG: RDD family protein [Ignavibacteriales bacterium]|nr:RDD family protein [Ignavibacteriales bacterium]
METQIPQPVFQQAASFHYAGFWRRFLAYIIDQMVMGVLGIFIVIPFLAMMGIGLWNEEFDPSVGFLIWLIGAYLTMILTVIIGEWLYYALMESMKGATLGKMALGIKVTDIQGNRISFGRATGRYFGKILSGLTLSIGYIMAAFTQQKQALHDILARCLVIVKD